MQADIPSGWKMRKLGDLSSFQNGAAFKPTEWSQSGKPIIRIQNLNGGNEFNYYDGEIDKKFGVSDGDLLFCWSGSRGTSFGPRYWHGPNGWLNQHIFNCHPARVISKEYLYFLLDQLTLQIEMQAHGGAGLVHIKKSELVKFEYAIPELSEQDRIVEILTNVDDSIRATEMVIAQAERVKRGLMEDLLTGGLGSEAIARGEVPEGWKPCTLSELALLQRGKFSARPRNDPKYYGGKIPFLQTGDVTNSPKYIRSYSQTLNEEGLKVSKLFDAGKILMSIAANVGDVAILTFDAAMPDSVVAIDPAEGVDRDYLFHLLRSKKNQLDAIATQNAQANLNLEKLNKFSLAVPNIEAQLKVSATLNSIDEDVAANLKVVQQLQRLKRGLMDDLLTGRVRTFR